LRGGGFLQSVRGICRHVQLRSATQKRFGSPPVHSSRDRVTCQCRQSCNIAETIPVKCG
jgi:hypothetical protein